jgi:phage baseplate assembly protein W
MYNDINVAYTHNSDPAYVQGMSSIIQSLTRLFNTKIGSVPFNRSYGSSLWNLLFENDSLETYQIELLMYQEISQWEPRVSLNASNITINKIDEHTFSLNITFIVPELNNAVGSLTQQITAQ